MTSIPINPLNGHPTPADAAPRRKPLLSILPAGGWAPIDFAELWRYRDLIQTLGTRDIKLRYRQTALGASWVVLQPLIAAAIFTIVFSKMLGVKGPPGMPYFVFAFAGQVAWQVFQSTLTKSGNCLVGNSHLVSKVYFPRLALPLSTIFSTLVDFLVAMLVMVALMIAFGIAPSLGVLLLPVWIGLLLTLALGAGLFLSSMMVTYRDVQHVLPVMMQLLMYVSPVAYTLDKLDKVPAVLRTVYSLNPLVGLLEGFRWSLFGSNPASPTPWLTVGYAAAMSIVVCLLGAAAFKRMERGFADVI